ncbi:hypothetical protein SAMN05660493_01730 [Epilithonimonas bovis DSM 19482]|uniref:Plasmid recombination enzyme n=1 Tax=Epilithonimonas bovis DSM 19482 TaxID=1121284 RepID=A0A1U7PWF3_9FLAO|nr:hypothetical protein [Epilithonimonas bovis]QIY84713.1 hypothetical protein HER18_14870 [Chryseobacterium sp. NEB161]SIT97027.1 hypothetical protein SAMN05660493_01730 [Epilithonimonas bovis DSM 19482]
MKTSINFKVAKSDSEIHNFRKKSFDYIRKDLTHKNEYWMEQKIADRVQKIESYCKENSGRKLQKNAMPVREAVVVIKENTTMQDLHNLSKRLEEELKIRIFQIAIHKDEGHYDKDTKEWKPNYHAHLVADWQDLETGKTLKHQSFHYSKMQDLAAECLEMERGVSGSLARLEAVEFKIKKREEDLKILEERYRQMQQEMESKNSEEFIVKESDFLGFQKIKTDKTIENYEKAFKTNNIQLLKNKTELESKEKHIAELKTKIESLKKEVLFFKSKNSALLTNETVFAVEKKKYMDSVENTLKKAILQESIKIPNLQNLNDTELKDKMIEIIEKTSKENNIPVSAFEEVFRISEKQINLFSLLRFDHRENKASEQNKVNSTKDNSLNIESQIMKEPEERKGFKR